MIVDCDAFHRILDDSWSFDGARSGAGSISAQHRRTGGFNGYFMMGETGRSPRMTMLRIGVRAMRRSREVLIFASASFGLCGPAALSLELGMPIACEVGRTCEIQSYVDI